MNDQYPNAHDEDIVEHEESMQQERPAPPPQAGRRQPTPQTQYAEVPQPFDPQHKSPRLAAFLSAIPGLGQVYVGYYSRGLVLAATWLMMLLFAANAPGRLEPVPGFAVFFLWVFNLIDAGRLAALYNHAMRGSRAIELPDDFRMPAMGGSIVGGAIMAIFGALALSNTQFGMSLDWLGNWWPAFPLALGVYLMARGFKDRAAAGR